MIYLVEDDNSIRELVSYTFNSMGLETKCFEKPSEFWDSLDISIAQAVILDIMLPEEDGLSILKKLRTTPQTENIPVMMLTAKGSEYDKVLGLELGADDYVSKPFGMMELVARVKALIRRTKHVNSDETESYSVGSLFVSTEKHMVKVEGTEVLLTLKEFEMLCLLLKNKGKVLTRDQLLNSVWGYDFDGESRTVDVHIRTLRQKLGKCGDYIETVRGIGYKIGEAKQ